MYLAVRRGRRNCGGYVFHEVDDDVAAQQAGTSWSETPDGYAARGIGNLTISLHRLVTCATSGQVVHHKNKDSRDNRRDNLVLCENSFEHSKLHNPTCYDNTPEPAPLVFVGAYLRSTQSQALRDLSQEENKSLSELIRESVDLLLKQRACVVPRSDVGEEEEIVSNVVSFTEFVEQKTKVRTEGRLGRPPRVKLVVHLRPDQAQALYEMTQTEYAALSDLAREGIDLLIAKRGRQSPTGAKDAR